MSFPDKEAKAEMVTSFNEPRSHCDADHSGMFGAGGGHRWSLVRRREGLLSCAALIGLLAALVMGPAAAHAQLPLPSQSLQPVLSPVAPTPTVPVPAVVPPIETQASADKALAQIYQNVEFWQQQGKPEAALQELVRVIAVSPPNADTLAMATRLALQLGHYDVATAYLARLRSVAPNDPRLAGLSAEQQLSPDSLDMLGKARQLVAAGRLEDAVKLYRQALNSKVPDSFAIEYYKVLGSASPDGFREASDGLSSVAARWPDDPSYKLAYAQLQTYQESTRAVGIDQLRDLSHIPAVAAAARSSWRDALLWQGADAQTRDELTAYLNENPSDPEIEAKRKDIEASLPDEGLLARMRAYEDGEAGRKADEEREFLAALQHNPDDAEAMIMLSIIRRGQGKIAESDKLIARAMALAPDRHDEFVTDIGFDPNAPKSAANAGNAIAARYAQVRTLTTQGRYDEAERLLRRLTGNKWNAGSYTSLGLIQSGAGHLPEAEQSFRLAIKSAPRNADAIVGLADVLTHLGRLDEADTQYASARELYTKANNRTGLLALNRSQAERLRVQAQADHAPADAIRLYRAALVIDPTNPWLRLDLARALQKQGQVAEARQIMAEAAGNDRPSVDTLKAAIIFADQRGDLAEANRLILRLPATERTPQMREDQERMAAREQALQATRAGTPFLARAQLLALAARPDPTGVRGLEIGQALIRLRDKASVRDAIAAALVNTPSQTVQQRLAYAGILLAADHTREAKGLVQGLNGQALSSAQQENMKQLLDGIALQETYQLNQRGRSTAALNVLTPRLAADPKNTDLNIALSRVYQTNGQAREAMAITDALKKRDPNNLDIRLASIDAAIALQESGRARALVADAIKVFPDDPQLYIRSADLARAQGRNADALSDLQRARDLRQKQLKQAP